MPTIQILILVVVLVSFSNPKWVCSKTFNQLKTLMAIKSDLDPEQKQLISWSANGDPCDRSYEGIGCDENGHITNISLQGKGLSGTISPSIGELKHLKGLFLHYNGLIGKIPTEISNLTELTDLYLNVNNLSGEIPTELGNMHSLQVLQLCYNQLTGSIPNQLAALKKLSVLSLQSNRLSGAIPASLGELNMLERLDLSFNELFGSIPAKLAAAPLLQVLDIRSNTLSGNVPSELERIKKGFAFENNLGLCGVGFPPLSSCKELVHSNPKKAEPYGASVKDIPETADLRLPCNASNCTHSHKLKTGSLLVGLIGVAIAFSAIGLVMFAHYRRHKQRLSTSYETSDNHLGSNQTKGIFRRNGSPLISLEYTTGWDPLSDSRNLNVFSQDVIQNFGFNLEEVETATQYFSERNLLGKSNFSATHKGILRDGSVVAIKSFSKSSCKSEESEFLRGLNGLASLKHENLVRLRGFCCSRDRGECFLIYDFVPNGSLVNYLDMKTGGSNILDWSSRVSIVKGLAKGIAYLHSYKPNKPAMVHQNISAEKVMMDQRYNPMISDSGLHNLLTNDVVFSALKDSAAMGYLAPEYASTGRFTEKSDVYAFGVLVFQILCGKRKVSDLVQLGAEACRFQDYIDPLLEGRIFEYEATKLARIAWLCTHESPVERPSMEAVVHELGNCSSIL